MHSTSVVPCRTLLYAFSHVQNDTRIRIGCGTHELGLLNGHTRTSPFRRLVGIHIQGYCNGGSMLPVVECVNGSNLAFTHVANIIVERIRFHNCKGPQQNVVTKNIRFYSVYFTMCTNVTMRDVELLLTAHTNSDGIGCYIPVTSIHLSNVYIIQANGWGNAISIAIAHTQATISITNVGIVRKGYRSPQSVLPTGDCYGILIDVYMGSHNVSVSNVAILDIGAYHSRAGGVSVRLHHYARLNNIKLQHISVVSGWQKGLDTDFKPVSQSLLYCENHSMPINNKPTEHTVANSTISAGIQIQMKTEANENSVIVDHSLVSHCKIWPGFVTAVLPKLWHWSYDHMIDNINSQAENTVGTLPLRRVGLEIKFTDNSFQNEVLVATSVFAHNRGKLGGGICVSFIQHSRDNVVRIMKATVAFNWAQSGGGAFVDFRDYTSENKFNFVNGQTIGNQAMKYGAGMFIIFQDNAGANDITVKNTNITHNILLQSNIHGRMGGGVQIGIATSKVKNVLRVGLAAFFHNQAVGATGGGLSVLYSRSDFMMYGCTFVNNRAAYGQAIAIEAFPNKGKLKWLHDGILLFGTTVQYYRNLSVVQKAKPRWRKMGDNVRMIPEAWQEELEMLQKSRSSYDPGKEVQIMSSGQSLVYLKDVEVLVEEYLFVSCGGSSQGIAVVDAEIDILMNSDVRVLDCVATHGGGVALLGESSIQISERVYLLFDNNYALNRGGAIYANYAQLEASSFTCFVHFKSHLASPPSPWNSTNITFINNRAGAEGNSIYFTNMKGCLQYRLINSLEEHGSRTNTNNTIFTSSPPFCFIPAGCAFTCKQLAEESNCSYHGEIVSGPSHVLGWNSSALHQTKAFIPGKQTTPLFQAVTDDFGNVVSSVFAVQVPQDSCIKVNPFSKFTSDFRVILHGTPFNQASIILTNSSEIHGNAKLILQSVDNRNLMIQVDIEMQCCPPGYLFTDKDSLGTCICAADGLQGILECKQDTFQAVLDKDHWAGYLQSDRTTQYTCNGLRFFTAPCPPAYCSPSVQLLPQNQSVELLEDLLCAPNKRRGVLCGECMEGHSMPANLNGLNPVCMKCDGALSRAGIIVWFVSEWLPMLILLAFMLIFNVDLISGKLNSFLLFAQLLSFSNIRGETENGLWGYTWFVKLYRFLYGIWNLEFFGVLLPPYCFTPTASLSTLQMLLLNYAIGLFPLTVTIILVVLDRSAEKWICCHPVDRCLRCLRKWKTKISNERSYDRALADFVILGFTRFMVTSAYILVRQTITAYDGTTEHRVWWQGTTHYGSADHIAALIPAIIIVGMFVLLPSVLLLSLPLFPQVVGRMIFYSKIKCVRKFQFIPTFCSNVYTDRWVYHFVNVLQGCYKDRCRCFASFFLFFRIIQLSAVIFTPRAENAFFIQLLTALIFLLMIAACQPYKKQLLNTVDMVIISDYALILLLSMHKSKESTTLPYKQACSIIQLVLIYLPLIYLAGLVIHKVRVKYPPKHCWKRNEPETPLNESLLIEDPRQRLGGLINITELRAGLPQDDVTATATDTSPTDSQYIQEEEDSTNM